MQSVRLSELIEIKHGFAFQSEFFGNRGTFALLTPGNFFEPEGFRYLGDSQKKYFGPVPPDYVLSEGDVLVAMTEQSPGLLGSSIKIPKGGTYLHNQRMGLVVLKRPDQITKGYLYHLFNTPHIRKEITADASGTKVKHTSPGRLCSIAIPLPSLHQQTKTSNILDEWDSVIESIERLIVAKRLHFSGLVRQLIIRRAEYEERWNVFPIRQFATRIQRQAERDDYPLLTISSAAGFVRQEDKYSRYMAGESAKTYTLIKAGEFAYNKGNSLKYQFGCVFQLVGHEAALVPSVYVCFGLHASVCADYMRHLFQEDYLKPQLQALVRTGVRNNGLLNIRPDEFMGVSVPVPPLAEQKRIAAVLNAAETEIAILEKQLIALRKQKRGLMQKLFSGIRRLKLAEAEAA